LELVIVQKEHAIPGRKEDSKNWNQIPSVLCKFLLLRNEVFCNQGKRFRTVFGGVIWKRLQLISC